jgi:hypothetical protein
MVYKGISGCRQGRNNVRLIEKLREAVKEADNIFNDIATDLQRLSKQIILGDGEKVVKSIIGSCRLQIDLNHPIHVEIDDTL